MLSFNEVTGLPNRIKGFDGLRAMMVVFEHKSAAIRLLSPGGFGVHLFFVLSGFLIIGILERRREAIEAGTAAVWAELWHFYENRIFRIWPIYFLLVFGLIVAGMTNIAKPLSA